MRRAEKAVHHRCYQYVLGEGNATVYIHSFIVDVEVAWLTGEKPNGTEWYRRRTIRWRESERSGECCLRGGVGPTEGSVENRGGGARGP